MTTIWQEIESEFTSDLLFTNVGLRNKINYLRAKFNEEDLLLFFIEKCNSKKNIQMQYLVPIFLLSNEFLNKRARLIAEKLSEKHLDWIVDKFNTTLNEEVLVEIFASKLLNLKSHDAEIDDREYGDNISEFDQHFCFIEKSLKRYINNYRIKEIILELVLYLANQDKIHHNNYFLNFILNNMKANVEWTSPIFNFLETYQGKSEETLAHIMKLQSTLGNGFYDLLYNYFNNKVMLTKNDFIIYTSLNNQYFNKYNDDIHLENVLNKFIKNMENITLYKMSRELDAFAELISALQTFGIKSSEIKNIYCMAYWNFIKTMLNDKADVIIYDKNSQELFIKYLGELNNNELMNDIKRYLEHYKDILFNVSKENRELLKLSTSKFCEISKFFAKTYLLTFDESNRYEEALNFINNSNNGIAIEYLGVQFLDIESKYIVAKEIINKNIEDPYIIRKYISLLDANNDNQLLLLLSNSEVDEIRYHATEKIVNNIYL